MAITLGTSGTRIDGNSDWEIRVNNSQVVEKLFNGYAQGNTRNPAFVYHGNGGWHYLTANTWNYIEGSRWGTGGAGRERGAGSYGFDLANKRYYAPVSGYYYIHCDFYTRCETNSTNNYIHLGINRNTARNWNNSRQPHMIHMHGNKRGAGAAYPSGPTCSAVMYMTQGQYAGCHMYKGNSTVSRFYGDHSFMCGHLLD
jgi:hypothetical protein